jgi:hypothetical protein
MRKVQRSEILDLQTYDRERERLQPAAMEAKAARRVHLGEHLTFLFENRETVRYQVQEMARAERLYRAGHLQRAAGRARGAGLLAAHRDRRPP